MNQAPRRRLRTHCLLLLLPLLVAGTPRVTLASTLPLPSPTSTTTFALESLAKGSSVPTGVALNVRVTAMTALGTVDPDYAGTVQFSTAAPRVLLPVDYTFNPSVDRGTKLFPVTFESPGTWNLQVQDGTFGLSSSISVTAVTTGPPVRFNLSLDRSTTAGTEYKLQVLPVDSANNPTVYKGRVHFATTVLRAQLPPDSDIDFTPGLQTPPLFTVTFASAAPDSQSITVTDVTGLNIEGSTSTVVSAGPFDHVALSTTAPDPTPTCSEATLVLTAVDASGNPVTDVPTTTPVKLCAASGTSVIFVKSSLDRPTYADACATGYMASTTAQVVWKDEKQEDVEFTLSSADAKTPLILHFTAGIPSPQKSSFSFDESGREPAPLLVRGGQLTAQLTLRDLCGNQATLPADKHLSFEANTPLALTPPVEDSPGRWTTSVSLSECPTDPSKTLAVWPLINGELLRKPSDGTQVQRLVQPQCSTMAKLSVLTAADSLVGEPGGMVEFEVRVSTEDDLTVTGGVLMLKPQGLTVLGASINGQDLPAKGGGYALPEVRKGSPLTVKVSAQMTTQLGQTVSTKVWAVNTDGTLLTQTESVDFQQKDLGVDVGCGCHATGLPGPLAWLALLLVASRPWGGLRRLRRGERNDP